MKLDIETVNLVSSDDLTAMDFGVSDAGMLFEILRSRMYSDPISAICREISCNSRDAHREAGKFDLPIEITVPTLISPVIKFKDWGPGIDPSRMEDIFIKYCASTKRNDNSLTGGFGLGSKTGFAYSDTFSVETIVNGIKYFYTAMIDDTRVGKMSKLSEESTDEPNGTTIIIPVRREHYKTFLDSTLEVTKYWDIRPIIKGVDPVPEVNPNKDMKILLSGQGWEVYVHDSKATNSYSSGSQGQRWNYQTCKYEYEDRLVALIDGIPYKVTAEKLDSKDGIIQNLCQRNVRIKFGIGELSLSSSREELHFDEKTKKKIIARLLEVSDAIAKDLSEQIKNASNLSEAELIHFEVSNKMEGTYKKSQVTWNNMALKGLRRTYEKKDGITPPSITHLSLHKSYRSDVASLRRDHRTHLEINSKSPIYINDVKKSEAPYKIVKEIIEKDPDVDSIQLITADQATLDYLDEIMDLKYLDVSKLSEGPKPVKKPRDTSKLNKIDAWTYDRNYQSGSNSNWRPTTLTKGQDGEVGDQLYVLCLDKRDNSFASGDMRLVDDDVNEISSFLSGETIYAVKDEKKLGKNWIKLADKLKELVDQRLSGRTLLDVYKEILSETYAFPHKMDSLEYVKKNISKINKKDNAFIRYIEESKNLTISISENKRLLYVGKLVVGEKYKTYSYDETILPIAKLYKNVLDTYPMLKYATSYYANASTVEVEHIIDYLNVVDASRSSICHLKACANS